MAYFDRVQDVSSTSGTGALTLSGTAATGYQTFASAFAINDSISYAITDATSGAWESGIGYLSASTTLVRNQCLQSSNAGAFVNFAANSKTVFCTLPATTATDNGLSLALRMGIMGV